MQIYLRGSERNDPGVGLGELSTGPGVSDAYIDRHPADNQAAGAGGLREAALELRGEPGADRPTGEVPLQREGVYALPDFDRGCPDPVGGRECPERRWQATC